MNNWILENLVKNQMIEKQLWIKNGKTVILINHYRFGRFTCISESTPLIDTNNQEGYEIGSDDCDWQMQSLDYLYATDWEFVDTISEKEKSDLKSKLKKGSNEELEKLGWSNFDTEYWLHGELIVANSSKEITLDFLKDPKSFNENELTIWFLSSTLPVHNGVYETKLNMETPVYVRVYSNWCKDRGWSNGNTNPIEVLNSPEYTGRNWCWRGIKTPEIN